MRVIGDLRSVISSLQPKLSASICTVCALSERAKGAEKAWHGETVVQKGAFGEAVFSLPPQGLLWKRLKILEFPENKYVAVHFRVLDDHFSARCSAP